MSEMKTMIGMLVVLMIILLGTSQIATLQGEIGRESGLDDSCKDFQPFDPSEVWNPASGIPIAENILGTFSFGIGFVLGFFGMLTHPCTQNLMIFSSIIIFPLVAGFMYMLIRAMRGGG